MKAIRPFRAAAPLAAVIAPLLAISCSAPRMIPPAAHAPEPRPAPYLPPPPQRPRQSSTPDWRDAPITAGNWSWSAEDGRSVARFAGGALELNCDRAGGTVTLRRALPNAGTSTILVSTSAVTRALPAARTPDGLSSRMAATDPLLDAIAFSRGRFAVAVDRAETLYVPSWPEISRVVEDCRG